MFYFTGGKMKQKELYKTAILGSAIYPGVGTVVGFVAGSLVCIFVDIFPSNWLDDLIDKIAK